MGHVDLSFCVITSMREERKYRISANRQATRLPDHISLLELTGSNKDRVVGYTPCSELRGYK